MTRAEMLDRLLAPSRASLAKTTAEPFQAAVQERLDTNRAFLESLTDADLAMRVATLGVTASNVRCACDGSVCACKPLRRGDSVARTDASEPPETPRERMIRDSRELGTAPIREGARRPEAPAQSPTYDGDLNASPRDRMMQRNAVVGARPMPREEIVTNGEYARRVQVQDDGDWQPPTSDPAEARARMLAHREHAGRQPLRSGK